MLGTLIADDDEPESAGLPPVCCTRCGARANGRAYAHCAKCHETFSGVTGFDRHRRGGECLDPATIGMIRTTRFGWTRWQSPGPDKEINYGE